MKLLEQLFKFLFYNFIQLILYKKQNDVIILSTWRVYIKYDEKLYNLGLEAYKNINIPKKNERGFSEKKNKFIKLLLRKFKKELRQQEYNNGIIKVRFERKFWSDFNDGYNELKELITSLDFDINSFLSEYCMYIGDIEYRCNEYTDAYFEIIWDYKTYYEHMFKENLDIFNQITNDPNDIKEHIDTYNNLPIKYKIEIINNLINNINKCKSDNEHDIAVKTCSTEGHKFGKWNHREWETIKDVVIDHQHVPNYRIKHEIWSRTCERCGFIEENEKMPDEIKQEIEQKRKQAKIKRLERELHRLKNE